MESSLCSLKTMCYINGGKCRILNETGSNNEEVFVIISLITELTRCRHVVLSLVVLPSQNRGRLHLSAGKLSIGSAKIFKFVKIWTYIYVYIHAYGLVQDCSNSSALALELLQSCTKLLIKFISITIFEFYAFRIDFNMMPYSFSSVKKMSYFEDL